MNCPATTAATPIIILSSTYVTAVAIAPDFIKSAVSKEKVEKVVNPSHIPVFRNNLILGSKSKFLNVAPMWQRTIPAILYHFRFSKASGLFEIIAPTIEQVFNSLQSPQIEKPFFSAHLRISHIFSQNTVFVPSMRQPSHIYL